jgi:hypothetical protein
MSRGTKPVTIALIAVAGVLGLSMLFCCGVCGFAGYQGKQEQKAREAREAPLRKRLTGHWVAYAVVKQVGDKRKKYKREPTEGLLITKETLRHVQEGDTPEAWRYALEGGGSQVTLRLPYGAGGLPRDWEVKFQKEELRLAAGPGRWLALRRDKKALASLMREQEAAWLKEEQSIANADVNKVSAGDYCASFAKDSKRAQRLYRKRSIELTGQIGELDFSDGDGQVILREPGCASDLWLYFPGVAGRQVIRGRRVGQQIKARCVGEGLFIDTPQLKSCQLLEVNGAPPPQEPVEVVKISAEALCSAYGPGRSARADKRYKNREVEVTGEVKEVSDGVILGTQVTLEASDCLYGVFLNFDRQETRAAAKRLDEGEQLRAACFWPGTSLGAMHLVDCELK